MSERVQAPFSEEQVKHLNEYQNCGAFHEFTCGNEDHPDYEDNKLIATTNGWICPNCDYKQYWAHSFMADGSVVHSWNEIQKILNRK